jgi:hypothetical protein
MFDNTFLAIMEYIGIVLIIFSSIAIINGWINHRDNDFNLYPPFFIMQVGVVTMQVGVALVYFC